MIPHRFRRLAFFLAAPVLLGATPAWDNAMALVRAKRYPEARTALEAVAAAEPANAAAWHELGLVWRARRDNDAYAQAVKCLETAARLEPGNAVYLADFGGTSLELANRTRSFGAATRGRDAMEKALAIDPDNLDTHEGLFQFYTRAPFIVGGSSAKAAAHLEAIRRRDPSRATTLMVLTKANTGDFVAAFGLCDDVLATHPNDYTALYQYGRTASLSGQNLERGLGCLQKALTIDPPGPAAPTHGNIWYRIGDIQQKLGRRGAARDAYESALKLDPGNRQASAALEALR